jgi:hypothetical protein
MFHPFPEILPDAILRSCDFLLQTSSRAKRTCSLFGWCSVGWWLMAGAVLF